MHSREADSGPPHSLRQRRKFFGNQDLMLDKLKPEPQTLSTPIACAFAREYALEALLGSGTVASVRVAARVSDGKKVAVKCVQSGDDEIRAFTREEYKLIQSLKHPHIVSAYAMYEDAVTVWICMELCDGGSLEQRVRRDGPCADYARLTCELLDAISHLHSKRIVHRDVKPDNLLLDSRGQLRLADFNSAKRIGDPKISAMLTDRGTRDFAAPELRFGRCWTERVDEWAAGLSVWFMIKGCLPFRVLDASVVDSLLRGQLPEIDWSGLTVNMRNFIEQILAVDPSDRTPAMELLWHPALAEDSATASKCSDFCTDSPKGFQVLELAGSYFEAEKERTDDEPVPVGSMGGSFWHREPRSGPEALQILAKTKCGRVRPSRQCAAEKKMHFHSAFAAVWELH